MFRVSVSGFVSSVPGSGFRISNSEFRVSFFVFRVSGTWLLSRSRRGKRRNIQRRREIVHASLNPNITSHARLGRSNKLTKPRAGCARTVQGCAVDQKGDTFERFKRFLLKVKASNWPCMCHTRFVYLASRPTKKMTGTGRPAPAGDVARYPKQPARPAPLLEPRQHHPT